MDPNQPSVPAMAPGEPNQPVPPQAGMQPNLTIPGTMNMQLNQAFVAGQKRSFFSRLGSKAGLLVVGLILLLISGSAVLGYTVYENIPEVVMLNMVEKLQSIKAVDYDATVKISIKETSDTKKKIEQYGISPSDFLIEASGKSDRFDENMAKSTMKLHVSVPISKDNPFKATLDMITMNKKVYFNISEFPDLPALRIDSLKNQWVFIDGDKLEEQLLGPDEKKKYDEREAKYKITDKQREQIIAILKKHRIITKLKKLPDETIATVPTHHYSFYIDTKELIAFANEAGKVNDPTTKPLDTTKYNSKDDPFKDVLFAVWIGKRDSYPYRMTATYTPTSGDAFGSVIFGLDLKEFNQPKQITPPTSFKMLEEVEKDLMRAYQTKPVSQNEIDTINSASFMNPSKQFAEANNTKRSSDIYQILSATLQYKADHSNTLPSGITTSASIISSSGANICAQLVPKYIEAFPVDPSMSNAQIVTDCSKPYFTRYIIQQSGGVVTVSAPAAELGQSITITR